MRKEDFEIAKQTMKCAPGGLKEACLVAKEYLQNSYVDENGNIVSKGSAVSSEEFLMASEILLASTCERGGKDALPQFYECDSDCSKYGNKYFCPGDFQLVDKSACLKLRKNPCPHFTNQSDK